MSIIWYTLYILGAITIVIVWINILTLFIKGCNVLLKKDEFKLQKKEDK